MSDQNEKQYDKQQGEQVTGTAGEQQESQGETAERSAPNWWELRPSADTAAANEAFEAAKIEEAKAILAERRAGGAPVSASSSPSASASTPASASASAASAASELQAAAQEAASGREEPGMPRSATPAAEPGLGASVTAGGSGRTAAIARKTNETDIKLAFNVDGTGKSEIETDVPFLNHMLDLFTKHGHFDLRVEARGDVDVDDHHTVEDIGICLGHTLREALGDKRGIKRYANVFIPMDEALAQVVIDMSNRPHFEYRAQYPSAQVGSFSTEMVHEFLWKLALEARMTLHVIVHYGLNTHHMIEAVFKALGRALDEATSIDPRVQGVPSTKGVL